MPERAVVIDGGSVGIELGQVLRCLGAQVSLVELIDHLMPREDPEVGAFIRPCLGRGRYRRAGRPTDDFVQVLADELSPVVEVEAPSNACRQAELLAMAGRS